MPMTRPAGKECTKAKQQLRSNCSNIQTVIINVCKSRAFSAYALFPFAQLYYYWSNFFHLPKLKKRSRLMSNHWLKLEARAEILKKFRCFFGQMMMSKIVLKLTDLQQSNSQVLDNVQISSQKKQIFEVSCAVFFFVKPIQKLCTIFSTSLSRLSDCRLTHKANIKYSISANLALE